MSARATSPFDTKHFMCDESHLPRISLRLGVMCAYSNFGISPPRHRPHYRLSTRPLNWNTSPIRALNPSTTSILCGNRLIDSEGSKFGRRRRRRVRDPRASKKLLTNEVINKRATVCARKTFPSWLEGDFLVSPPDRLSAELSDVASHRGSVFLCLILSSFGSLFY